MSVDTIAQMVITGVTLGLIYALIAIGLNLIFGVMRIIQYAHGEIYMLGAYFLYYWFSVWGLPYWLGLAMSAIVIFIFGMGLQVVLFRPLHGKEMLYSLAVSLALIFVISSTGLIVFGTVVRGIPSVISGGVTILGAQLTYERAAIAGISIVLIVGLYLLLQKTK
ncbi:MAG: branched-chain amino acid ABC transporter permease, partial [Spirochaetales bacterium]